MGIWWENKTLKKLQRECDEAFYKKDSSKSRKMADLCFQMGEKSNEDLMMKANYFYCAGTCILDAIGLERHKRQSSEIEREYEKCIYLFRTAKNCYSLRKESLINAKENNLIEQEHNDNLYKQLTVNYANCLSQSGRYIQAIRALNDIKKLSFPMAIGNLALKIADYSQFDSSHEKIMLYHAYQLLKKLFGNKTKFQEKEYAIKQFEEYFFNIESIVGEEYLKENYTIEDFLIPFENLSEKEGDYRLWIAKSNLALNQLNDIFSEVAVGYDPLQLDSLITDTSDTDYPPKFYSLFNQIKQEYVSARYFVYEGLMNRNQHYSDKYVSLINTLDYPVYGLGIEKIKSAYRSVYSIFDKIAYFLNEYLDLGIPKNLITFHSLWYKKHNRKTLRRKNLIDLFQNNYMLYGLWWIYKDLRNKSVYGNKYIDPNLEKIAEIRNAMEHKSFNILDYYSVESSSGNFNNSEFSYIISYTEFEKITLELFKLTREAIIQLTMIVQMEESKKRQKINKSGGILGELPLFKYKDEWKNIY